MQARDAFRSPHGLCLSGKLAHVNVPGWLAATTLATRAPGRENRRYADCSPHPWGSPLRGQRKRCPKLLPAILSSAYPFRLPGRAWGNVPVRPRPQPASMRAAPARSERLGDFQPDPTPRFNTEPTAISLLLWSTVSQRGGWVPAETGEPETGWQGLDAREGGQRRNETRCRVEPAVGQPGGRWAQCAAPVSLRGRGDR